jgi:hypothetical protein
VLSSHHKAEMVDNESVGLLTIWEPENPVKANVE